MKAQPDPRLRYVGFWPRVWAQVIDSCAASVLLAPLAGVAPALANPGDVVLRAALLQLATSLIPSIVLLVLWRYWQSSPGKYLIGARIIDAQTGGVPSTRQLVVRMLGYLPCTLALGLGFLAVRTDPRGQGWHDRWARTVVIYHPQNTPPSARP